MDLTGDFCLTEYSCPVGDTVVLIHNSADCLHALFHPTLEVQLNQLFSKFLGKCWTESIRRTNALLTVQPAASKH